MPDLGKVTRAPSKAIGCPVAAHEIPTDPIAEFVWTGEEAHEVIVRVCSSRFRIDHAERQSVPFE